MLLTYRRYLNSKPKRISTTTMANMMTKIKMMMIMKMWITIIVIINRKKTKKQTRTITLTIKRMITKILLKISKVILKKTNGFRQTGIRIKCEAATNSQKFKRSQLNSTKIPLNCSPNKIPALLLKIITS